MKVRISATLDTLGSLISQLKRTSDEIGGIAVFVGAVRGSRGDERVLRLEYEAHENLAAKVVETIIEDSKTKHGIVDAIVEHRIGSVEVGEDVMYVLIASKHREEGFKALKEMVDRIKREVPIWKKEVTEKEAYWVENP
jgi:molybdopterin synthase catalytic subunit